MPIHINLLAEARATEELRRRDPVKRAIWVGVLLVLAVLAWSSSLWLKALIIKSDLGRMEAGLNSHTNIYQQVLENRRTLADVDDKLSALQVLKTNRFLNGTLLNALQQATVPNVQLTHVKVDMSYSRTEAIKAKTSGGHVSPAKPATVTERIRVTLEARDSSPTPGDGVTKYKQAIASFPYFQEALGKTNEVRLKDLGAPQVASDGKPFLLFTLECRYPEKTR
jgi:hypothetical protein